MNEEIIFKGEPAARIERTQFRNLVCKLEDYIRQLPGAMIGDNDVHPLKHSFADGCYIREVSTTPGQLVVSKIHKVAHPFFLLKGEMSILTEEGVKRIKAPYYGITPAGTKRVLLTHSDIIFVTVHVTKETDLQKIEDELIAKDFGEFDVLLKGETS